MNQQIKKLQDLKYAVLANLFGSHTHILNLVELIELSLNVGLP